MKASYGNSGANYGPWLDFGIVCLLVYEKHLNNSPCLGFGLSICRIKGTVTNATQHKRSDVKRTISFQTLSLRLKSACYKAAKQSRGSKPCATGGNSLQALETCLEHPCGCRERPLVLHSWDDSTFLPPAGRFLHPWLTHATPKLGMAWLTGSAASQSRWTSLEVLRAHQRFLMFAGCF